jgi:DNA-binding XRE family transcriptional regulator
MLLFNNIKSFIFVVYFQHYSQLHALLMNKDNIDWFAMSDVAILEQLGNFIKETRLQQNKTQEQVAQDAGINRTTLSQIENGAGGNMLSYIQLLRVLNKLHLFNGFQVKQQLSPLQLAKLEQNKRVRATGACKKSSTHKPLDTDW